MYSIKILRGFSNHREKQPALRFLKVQAAFDRERSSENYFSGSFEITGNMKVLLVYDPTTACCQPYYGMVWNHSVTTKIACVRTAHTLHLNLKVCIALRQGVWHSHTRGWWKCRLWPTQNHTCCEFVDLAKQSYAQL